MSLDNTTLPSEQHAPAVVKYRRPRLSQTQLAARRARKALLSDFKKEAVEIISIKQRAPVTVPVEVKVAEKARITARQIALKAIDTRIKRTRFTLRLLTEALAKIADEHGTQELGEIAREPIAPTHVILRCVSEHFGVPINTIRSERRDEATVTARHVAFYLCEETGRSFKSIGRHFDRDHTTIMFGVRKIKAALKDDRVLVTTIDIIRKAIKATI